MTIYPYVKIDDQVKRPRWPGRPPLLTDSELICLAVAQSLLQVHSEARRSDPGVAHDAALAVSPSNAE